MKNIQMNLFLFIMTVSLFVFAGCTNLQDNTIQEMPEDFNFSFTYGSYGKQKIDTFNDIIIKDLVEDGTFEANISLTVEEKQQIYNEMMKINIMGELNLDKDKECEAEPSSLSKWNIQMNGQTKSLYYTTYCEYPKDVLDLIKLEDFIHNVVFSKDEYKELPEARGEYE